MIHEGARFCKQRRFYIHLYDRKVSGAKCFNFPKYFQQNAKLTKVIPLDILKPAVRYKKLTSFHDHSWKKIEYSKDPTDETIILP